MSQYDKKDMQILEMLFYAEQGAGFSAILEETKISRSTLARHLRYLEKKEGYISKVPDEKNRFFVYELTKEGEHEIIPILLEKNHIGVFSEAKKGFDYQGLKRFLLEKREHEILEKKARTASERNAFIAREKILNSKK